MRTIVHVNQHNIKHNAKTGEAKPVLTVKTYLQNRIGQTAKIMYNGVEVGRFVYQPDKPLSCGAKVWFNTDLCTVEIE